MDANGFSMASPSSSSSPEHGAYFCRNGLALLMGPEHGAASPHVRGLGERAPSPPRPSFAASPVVVAVRETPGGELGALPGAFPTSSIASRALSLDRSEGACHTRSGTMLSWRKRSRGDRG